jgi:hypothetical protein
MRVDFSSVNGWRRAAFGGAMALLGSSCSLVDLDGFHAGDAPTAKDAGAADGASLPDGPSVADGGDETTIGESCGDQKFCALAPPNGWSFVTTRFGGAGDCPTGYSSGTDLVERLEVPQASCDCACGAPTSPGSCTDGTASVQKGSVFVCLGGSSITTSAACTSASININAGEHVRLNALAPKQAACTGSVQSAKPAPAPTRPARSCALTALPTSDGCANGRRCVPAPIGSYGLCIAQVGSNSSFCPSGYSRRHSLGTSVSDSRQCVSCTCETTDTCTNARVELFTVAGCSSPDPLTINADGKCQSPGAGAARTYQSARYVADRVAGSACQVKTEEIAGAVDVNDGVTICCPASGGGG